MPLDPRGLEAFTDAAPAAADLDLARRIAALERTLAGTGGWVPGDLKISAKANPDPGWLLANGAQVSRTTYAALFAAIGTTYGAGNGSTTFSLPSSLCRFPVGAFPAGTVGRQQFERKLLGEYGGADYVTLTGPESGTNTNGVTDAADRSLDHLHNPYPGYNYYWQTAVGDAAAIQIGQPFQANASVPSTGGADRSIDHLHSLQERGADLAHLNLSPYFVVNYFIRY